MSKILDPANTDDQAAFDEIRELVGFTDTDSEINSNPLFSAAEDYILSKVPSAALPGGRTASNRADVVNACVFLASSYFLDAGKSTSTASSTVKSETILGIRREFVVSESSTSGQSMSVFLKSLVDDILYRLTGSTGLGDLTVIVTQ